MLSIKNSVKISTIIFVMIFSFGVMLIPSQGQATTLTIWYFQDETQDDTLLSQIAAFGTEKGITINATHVDFADLVTKYKSAYQRNEAPDIIQGDAAWIADLAHGNYLLPLQYDYLHG